MTRRVPRSEALKRIDIRRRNAATALRAAEGLRYWMHRYGGADETLSRLVSYLAADYVVCTTADEFPANGWGSINPAEHTITLAVHDTALIAGDTYRYVLAHLLLHVGLGHSHDLSDDPRLAMAREMLVDQFLLAVAGPLVPPPEYLLPDPGPLADEARLAALLSESFTWGQVRSLAGIGRLDYTQGATDESETAFAEGLQEVLETRLAATATDGHERGFARQSWPAGERARHLLVSRYPLLAALAAKVTLVTDSTAIARAGIHLAATNPSLGEVYLNAGSRLSVEEIIFALAHELLHLGLRHGERIGGRDAFIWNCACDFVINKWLIEMGVGKPPVRGLLYDPGMGGLSAEQIYDVLVGDRRAARRLSTLAGVGKNDIILDTGPRLLIRNDVASLEEAYKMALRAGLWTCERVGRGTLPADLVEEIRALDAEPIPWDVALAHWFERYLPEPGRQRTYARPSRRQASTPDIPRPSYYTPLQRSPRYTFGVILDTSGSMDRPALARALGVIAAYAAARSVDGVRLVMCDATPYDEGYVSPERLRRVYPVKGRGGTVLEPAVRLLEAQPDFPATAPVLVLTDGHFEPELRLARTHAWVLPVDTYVRMPDLSPVFRVL